MKRGRHNMRRSIQEEIIKVVSSFNTPITTSVMRKEVSKILNQNTSWNTIQKYLTELVEAGRIQPIQLQHSKVENKPGLTVYTLKK